MYDALTTPTARRAASSKGGADRAAPRRPFHARRASGARRLRAILVVTAEAGSGGTTMATTIASALAAAGRRVALADADPRRSSLAWLERRPAEAPLILAIDGAAAPRPRLADRLSRRPIGRAALRREAWRDIRAAARKGQADWLVIDAPIGDPSFEGDARDLIAKADLVIAPIAPSAEGAPAAQRLFAQLGQAPTLRRSEAKLLVVANRIRRRRRLGGRLADPVDRFFSRLGVEPAAAIGEGAAYPALTADGLGVFDPQVVALGPRKAEQLRAEWRPLLRAIGLDGANDDA